MREFRGWGFCAGNWASECTSGPSTAVVEVYPALWKHAYPVNGRTSDQHDAYSAAAWLRDADLDGRLDRFLSPELTAPQRAVAGVEGWILGVS